jgi:hypothetical protein
MGNCIPPVSTNLRLPYSGTGAVHHDAAASPNANIRNKGKGAFDLLSSERALGGKNNDEGKDNEEGMIPGF